VNFKHTAGKSALTIGLLGARIDDDTAELAEPLNA